jgi:hypothetical protein
MRAAGIDHYGDSVRLMSIPEPRRLESDELLLQVRAAGVGNWDNIARTGGWDLGIAPPMSLGVEAAGTALAINGGFREPECLILRQQDQRLQHAVPLHHVLHFPARTDVGSGPAGDGLDQSQWQMRDIAVCTQRLHGDRSILEGVGSIDHRVLEMVCIVGV